MTNAAGARGAFSWVTLRTPCSGGGRTRPCRTSRRKPTARRKSVWGRSRAAEAGEPSPPGAAAQELGRWPPAPYERFAKLFWSWCLSRSGPGRARASARPHPKRDRGRVKTSSQYRRCRLRARLVLRRGPLVCTCVSDELVSPPLRRRPPPRRERASRRDRVRRVCRRRASESLPVSTRIREDGDGNPLRRPRLRARP
jgi:hypothetical protein